jgi:hypothetical protein
LDKLRKSGTTTSGFSTATPKSGLSSSLVFTPVQGLEFVDPNAQQRRIQDINDKWFSANAKFVNVKKKEADAK